VRRARALAAAASLALAAAAAAPQAETEGKKRSAAPNRHGAFAQHRASASWGVGYDFVRQRDASAEALKQCGHPKCEIVHRFRNGCAALADGPAKSAAASGVTRAEAETKALRRCGEANRGAECQLLAWGCTR
jgi:hypothetical protein